MIKINPIRGTHDLYKEDANKHAYIKNTFQKVLTNYNFEPFQTPIMESSDVFNRTLGQDSDVVMKEMYTFDDKSGDSITLRPEGTAGIARAVISNGLTQSLPIKVYYDGPMFRYERPQKGRLRQFHQIGIEYLGDFSANSDIEVILSGYQLLKELKLDKKVFLEINSIGDEETRKKYRKILVQYLNGKKKSLSKLSVQRLELNPLRILDSKNLEDKDIIKDAPKIHQYLSKDSETHFKQVTEVLDYLKIEYLINPCLVRGLDYYCHTTFEYITKDAEKNLTVLAGGRYNGLISQLGGPEIPGIGWAAGVERLAMLTKIPLQKKTLVSVLSITEKGMFIAFEISKILVNNNITHDLSCNNNIKKALKYSNKINASFAIIIGESEIKSNSFKVKNLENGIQDDVSLENLVKYLNAK